MCFDVDLGGFLGVVSSVNVMATGQVRVVGGLFMIPRLMMLGRFHVMMLGVSVVLRSLVVVFGSLL